MEYTGYEYVIAEDDADGYVDEFTVFLGENYPGMAVEIIRRQSGGTILLMPNGEEATQYNCDFTANDLWDEFCNS